MIKKIILIGLLIAPVLALAQLSSLDIRQASGKGPYPFYLNLQLSNSGTKNTFSQFINAYSDEFGIPRRRRLFGVDANIGVVINTDDFLGIRGLAIRRASVELGYRYLGRRLKANDGRQLRITQEMLSLRGGYRFNILYPLTLQLQAGVAFMNLASVQEINGQLADKLSLGQLVMSRRPSGNRDLLAGFDLRARLMLLDPAGTTGGLGFYIEGQYFCSCKTRNLAPFYDRFLGRQVDDLRNWNYFTWSVGMVAPLALPMPSNKSPSPPTIIAQ